MDDDVKDIVDPDLVLGDEPEDLEDGLDDDLLGEVEEDEDEPEEDEEDL